MFEQSEDADQMWEKFDEKNFEGSAEPGEAMEEDSEESIEAEQSKMDYAYVQVSKNNQDMQVRPYQLSCLPNPKRFPHIGRVNVTIDWLQILGLPLKKRVGINEINFDAAWPGMLGDDRSGTGMLINGAPGLYQWVMTSAHIVFPAQRMSHFEKCVQEIKETEKKIRKELETDNPDIRTTIVKSTLLEAIVDVLARLAEFQENLKEIRGDWFKIPNCPMKVSFAHQCHGNLNRTAQPVKTWKIYDTFEGRWGLGDDYQSDVVGAIKRYRGQDIAVMKLERPLQLTEAPFSLITLEGSEEDIQRTLPPVEIWGYVCDQKGHIVEHSDGRRLKYPSSNTFIRGHASQCTQSQHRFPPNSLDVRPQSPYILQVRGEFNVGHSGAVGFVECGDKKFGVGVLSGPNLSRDTYNGDPYLDSILTGFSAPVVGWLQEVLPKRAMPPQQRFHVSDFSAYIKENSSKPAEECSQQNIARSKEDDLWETTRLKNVTLRKRKKSFSPTPALEWNGKSSGTPTPGMKRKLEVADFRPPKKTKLNQEAVSA